MSLFGPTLIVGERYPVLHVHAVWNPYHGGDLRSAWWPVIGPLHDDADPLDFPALHWHVDSRFLKCRHSAFHAITIPLMIGLMHPPEDKERLRKTRNEPGGRSPDYNAFHRERLERYPVESWLKIKTVKCQRIYPNAPPGVTYGDQPRTVGDYLDALERVVHPSMPAGCRVDPRRPVCPHRGAPLNGLPAVNGVVRCPVHGLRFSAATGELLEPQEERRDSGEKTP